MPSPSPSRPERKPWLSANAVFLTGCAWALLAADRFVGGAFAAWGPLALLVLGGLAVPLAAAGAVRNESRRVVLIGGASGLLTAMALPGWWLIGTLVFGP